MIEVTKSQWDFTGHVTRFEALVSIGDGPNVLAPEYCATIKGYIGNAGNRVWITEMTPREPLDAVIILTHVAQGEGYLIQEVKRLEVVG